MGERGGGEEKTSVGIFFQMEIQIFWRVYDHARARSGGFCRRRRGGVARPAAVPTKSGRGPEMRRGMRRKHARYAPTPQPPPPDPLWIRAHFHFRGAGGVRLTHDWYVELERDVLQELEAIHVRHVHVGEHDVEVVLALAQGLQRLGTAREGGDCVVESREGSASAKRVDRGLPRRAPGGCGERRAVRKPRQIFL